MNSDDYPRTAALLREMLANKQLKFVDRKIYPGGARGYNTAEVIQCSAEQIKALVIAVTLCESVAAPVDEAKERVAFEDEFPCAEPTGDEHYPYRGDIAHAQWCAWLARARSDARAKVAEAECEKLRKVIERLLDARSGTATEVMYAIQEARAALLPPPPTVEGDGG